MTQGPHNSYSNYEKWKKLISNAKNNHVHIDSMEIKNSNTKNNNHVSIEFARINKSRILKFEKLKNATWIFYIAAMNIEIGICTHFLELIQKVAKYFFLRRK